MHFHCLHRWHQLVSHKNVRQKYFHCYIQVNSNLECAEITIENADSHE